MQALPRVLGASLISGALDAVVGALDASGRLREAHQVNKERAALLGAVFRGDLGAAAEGLVFAARSIMISVNAIDYEVERFLTRVLG